MADSEFDELDKAVASVLQPTAPVDTPSAAVTPTPDVSEEPSEPVAELITEPITAAPAEPASQPSVPQAAPAAPRVRSAGRFMDVVPPSTFTPHTPLPAPPERAEPLKPAVEALVAPAPFEQPDPLDFNGLAAPEPTALPAQEATADEPLATPFLSDAKVEKRPLGAFSDTPKIADDEAPEVPAPDLSKPLAEEDKAVAPDVDLPAELHTDLLSIEATEPAMKEEATPVPSIVQQYQEKPNSDMRPSAAIYDTDAYHMPSSRPVKKRASWLVPVWIAAIVVVGGAIGAGFYFLILPMI